MSSCEVLSLTNILSIKSDPVLTTSYVLMALARVHEIL